MKMGGKFFRNVPNNEQSPWLVKRRSERRAEAISAVEIGDTPAEEEVNGNEITPESVEEA